MATASTSQLPHEADHYRGPPLLSRGRPAPDSIGASKQGTADSFDTGILTRLLSCPPICLGIHDQARPVRFCRPFSHDRPKGRRATRSWTPSLATIVVAVSAALAARMWQWPGVSDIVVPYAAIAVRTMQQVAGVRASPCMAFQSSLVHSAGARSAFICRVRRQSMAPL